MCGWQVEQNGLPNRFQPQEIKRRSQRSCCCCCSCALPNMRALSSCAERMGWVRVCVRVCLRVRVCVCCVLCESMRMARSLIRVRINSASGSQGESVLSYASQRSHLNSNSYSRVCALSCNNRITRQVATTTELKYLLKW